MVEIPTTVKNKDLVERRRRQLVLAGIKLFSRNGFHKSTLKDLAEEAGLSYGNIYDYVGSKEDIFFLIHDFLAGSAMEILNRSIEEVKDPVEKLRRMIQGEFNLMDQWADALLLIYQESHILKGTFLGQLLEKERAHLEKFEIVLNECISQGRLRPCNVRLVSNLIKSMIDSWTIKRWDLRGRSSRVEAERSIMDMITRGLLMPADSEAASALESNSMAGKTALVINGGTVLGQAICSELFAAGLRVIVHTDIRTGSNRISKNTETGDGCNPAMVLKQSEDLTPLQVQDIERKFGPIDVCVHDLGAGTIEKPESIPEEDCGLLLDKNLQSAKLLSGFFREKMEARAAGRIVYLAPWAWDAYADPIRFEVAKAGAVALTQALSRQLAACGVNVNCVVPGYIRGIRPLKIEKALGRDLLEKIPSGRLGEIFDVTAAVLFSIREESKYLTGQVFHVTGGH